MKGVPPIVRLAICRWFRENADTDTVAKAGMTPGCFQLTRKREQGKKVRESNSQTDGFVASFFRRVRNDEERY